MKLLKMLITSVCTAFGVNSENLLLNAKQYLPASEGSAPFLRRS